MLTRNRLIQLIIMFTLLIGLFVWRTINFEEAGKVKVSLDATVPEGNVTICQLTDPCIYESDVGDFTLTLHEEKIVPEEWYHLTLQSETKHWTIESAQVVSQKGIIGKIPVDFVLANTEQGDDVIYYNAKSMVGVYSEKSVLLKLQITLLVNGKEIHIDYNFFVSN